MSTSYKIIDVRREHITTSCFEALCQTHMNYDMRYDMSWEVLLLRQGCIQEIVDKEQGASPLPVFMAGLSMGGLTSILVALRNQSVWKVADFCPMQVQLTAL